MLKRLLLALVVTLALVASAGEERAEGIAAPNRLTVGLADQLLGQLTPDAGQLYYLSTLHTSSEVAFEEPPGGRPRVLFDENADVTWPRVSPDGKHLAYVSLGDHATGQLCVRTLPKGEPRVCLETPVGALQAEWMNATTLGLVVRDTIQGDLRSLKVTLGSSLTATPLPWRNLVSPAFSPDGRWLIYVPVSRYSEQVGPGFAASASAHLEAVRLDRPGAAPVALTIDAPGVTAQPMFSHDGRWLYFTQFVHDSDGDGQVDALDHGVIFRVAFDGTKDDAVARLATTTPEQLSDGTWNCQYPAPSASMLVASCSQKDNVDVYELPMDGVVPRGWKPDRLKAEVELAPAQEQQLLLFHRVLESEPSLSSRHRAMVRMVRLHLELEDFGAARFYAKRVGELEDPETAGVSRPLQALVALREGKVFRAKGRVVTGWGDLLGATRALLTPGEHDSSAARALSKVVESEAWQLAGDFGASRASLQAAVIDQKTPRAVLELYADRADALFRTLDDEPALQAALRTLLAASRKPEVQLEYARAWAHSLIRGKPWAEKEALVARELEQSSEGSEARFALELQRALMIIRGPEAPGALEALRALTRAQTRPDRKKAILLESTERASDLGAMDLLEALVRDAIVDFPLSSSDRLRVEQQFAAVVLGRAYSHRAKGEYDAALEDFESVARETRSLEALVGALDLHLKAGMKPAALVAKMAGDQAMASELRAYGQAWVLLRSLPDLGAAEQKKVREQCFALLKSEWRELRGHRLGQALSGALRHEDYLAEWHLDQAEHANANYLTALRITRGTPRQTAMVLGQAGLLQLEVGNYRLALAQLDEREKFPFIDNGSGLAVQLGRARALLHVGRMPEAVETVEEGLAMTTKSPKLAQWHVLALDRAALINLAADKYERALALYDEAIPSLQGRNLLVARLARAAAALGAKAPERALADLDAFDQGFAKAELRLPHQTVERSTRSYQLISAGLRANAQQALGHTAEAATALEHAHGLLAATFKEDDRDDELKALALTEARLGELSQRSWAETAVAHADQFAARTGTALSEEQVDTVWLQATLYQRHGEKLPPALAERMRRLLDAMTVSADRLWRVHMRWFEVALALDALPVEPKVRSAAAESAQ